MVIGDVTAPTAVRAIGRIGPGGPWVGFARGLAGYRLLVGDDGADADDAASTDDLVALAVVYFEDSLDAPPDDLAATLGDIGTLVRDLAAGETDADRRRLLEDAVDAVDDGLAEDVTIARLARVLRGEADAASRVRRRVDELRGSS
jgi:hypothetical protein